MRLFKSRRRGVGRIIIMWHPHSAYNLQLLRQQPYYYHAATGGRCYYPSASSLYAHTAGTSGHAAGQGGFGSGDERNDNDGGGNDDAVRRIVAQSVAEAARKRAKTPKRTDEPPERTDEPPEPTDEVEADELEYLGNQKAQWEMIGAMANNGGGGAAAPAHGYPPQAHHYGGMLPARVLPAFNLNIPVDSGSWVGVPGGGGAYARGGAGAADDDDDDDDDAPPTKSRSSKSKSDGKKKSSKRANPDEDGQTNLSERRYTDALKKELESLQANKAACDAILDAILQSPAYSTEQYIPVVITDLAGSAEFDNALRPFLPRFPLKPVSERCLGCTYLRGFLTFILERRAEETDIMRRNYNVFRRSISNRTKGWVLNGVKPEFAIAAFIRDEGMKSAKVMVNSREEIHRLFLRWERDVARSVDPKLESFTVFNDVIRELSQSSESGIADSPDTKESTPKLYIRMYWGDVNAVKAKIDELSAARGKARIATASVKKALESGAPPPRPPYYPPPAPVYPALPPPFDPSALSPDHPHYIRPDNPILQHLQQLRAYSQPAAAGGYGGGGPPPSYPYAQPPPPYHHPPPPGTTARWSAPRMLLG